MEIVIVTGMSGAGKSSVLKLFEDMGYYCMDNLPPQLMTNFLELAKNSSINLNNVAIGVDIRGGAFFDALRATIVVLKDMNTKVSILYLEADDDVLIRRYKELRRPHPMDKAGNIYDGIQREKATLKFVRENADYIVDTSHYNLGQLKGVIDSIYLKEVDNKRLAITVNSFGYKYGIQMDADLVFDVRFIPNPYYIPELKKKTGESKEIKDYLFSFNETTTFIDKTIDLIEFLLPYYRKEGKRTLSIGIGCTGGRHRSVAITEALAERLKGDDRVVFVTHRDRRYWK